MPFFIFICAAAAAGSLMGLLFSAAFHRYNMRLWRLVIIYYIWLILVVAGVKCEGRQEAAIGSND